MQPSTSTRLLELVNFILKHSQSKRVLISGCPSQTSSVLIIENPAE